MLLEYTNEESRRNPLYEKGKEEIGKKGNRQIGKEEKRKEVVKKGKLIEIDKMLFSLIQKII